MLMMQGLHKRKVHQQRHASGHARAQLPSRRPKAAFTNAARSSACCHKPPGGRHARTPAAGGLTRAVTRPRAASVASVFSLMMAPCSVWYCMFFAVLLHNPSPLHALGFANHHHTISPARAFAFFFLLCTSSFFFFLSSFFFFFFFYFVSFAWGCCQRGQPQPAPPPGTCFPPPPAAATLTCVCVRALGCATVTTGRRKTRTSQPRPAQRFAMVPWRVVCQGVEAMGRVVEHLQAPRVYLSMYRLSCLFSFLIFLFCFLVFVPSPLSKAACNGPAPGGSGGGGGRAGSEQQGADADRAGGAAGAGGRLRPLVRQPVVQ